MAKVICDWCGTIFEENEEKCPNCGRNNEHFRKVKDVKPKTIEQLKVWYIEHNLPPYETTRFFIDIDYKEPKAFGIYKEGERFIVYKNKGNGERSIRYEGNDEAYAVNELYEKIKSEILNQRMNQKEMDKGNELMMGITVSAVIDFFAFAFSFKLTLLSIVIPVIIYVIFMTLKKNSPKFKKIFGIGLLIYTALCLVLIIGISMHNSRPRYYKYEDHVYCYYDDYYYLYDDYGNDYYYVENNEVPSEIINTPDDYALDDNGDNWNDSYRFQDSTYYEEHYSSDDSDYDWDSSDSWDSGSTDWDSDW